VGLLGYVFKAAEEEWRGFNQALATGIAAPVIFALVWWILHRVRTRMMRDETSSKV
jgi:uncharacterized membrane-anchored protein